MNRGGAKCCKVRNSVVYFTTDVHFQFVSPLKIAFCDHGCTVSFTERIKVLPLYLTLIKSQRNPHSTKSSPPPPSKRDLSYFLFMKTLQINIELAKTNPKENNYRHNTIYLSATCFLTRTYLCFNQARQNKFLFTLLYFR